MNTKLTLSVDPLVVEKAKKYAKTSGKSLSNIVEEYLKSLSHVEHSNNKRSKSEIVRYLKGSVKLPKENHSYRELLEDALLEKYLKQ